MTERESLELEVAEARTRDVGRALARLNRQTMSRLGLRPGDFIEVEGKRRTVAIAWPAYTEDEDHDIIRIDGVIRHNAGTSIGETVRISKVDLKPISKLVLAPTEPIRFSSDFGVYVRQILEDKPLSKGDTVMIPILGEALRLIITSIQPDQSGYVTEDSEVAVKEEPVKEMDTSRPKVSYEDIGGLEDARRK